MIGLLRLALVACLIGAPAQAWETQVDGAGPNQWRSLYQLRPPEPIRGLVRPRAMTDEHTRLSDLALKRLGVGDLFARGGSAELSIIDLNASLFRRELLDGLPTVGDDESTPLEERLIPPPAHFSGVPDYSFTIYDWLNKNQLCPPGPMGNRCHEYMFGWLGNLNATHFGSQATGMYRHYHGVAIEYASRARALHLAARRAGNGEDEAYLDHIREAELEALAYEGYAQHFLQDRWALGHMWERWNGPDPDQIPTQDNLDNTLVSAVAGLMHGSESVVAGSHGIHIPEEVNAYLKEFYGVDLGTDDVSVSLGQVLLAADPMSSPIVRDGELYPLRWRHASLPEADPFPGVGDDRLADIGRGSFGAGYGYATLLPPSVVQLEDKPLHVEDQFEKMLACSTAGYAEVIEAFGQFDGTYGAWKAPLVKGAPEFEVTTQDTCWDMWATNEAMFEGFSNSASIDARVLGRAVYWGDLTREVLQAVAAASGSDALSDIPVLPRRDILQVLATIEVMAQDDPFGTQLARGEIGPFDVFAPGNAYDLPGYAHPALLKDLPKDSENGLDRKTLSGAFSRAHSDYWCENMAETLRDLRAQEEPHKVAACEYLAGFAFGGTEDGYSGSMQERLLYQGQEIKSICALRGVADGSVFDTPSKLPPGYVDATRGPDAISPSGMGPQSVANWCAKVPVLRLSPDPELADQNLVAEIDPEAETLTLEGIDLGERPGRISVAANGNTHRLGVVLDWSPVSVTLELENTLEGDTTYDLEVFRADDDMLSVGLFQLRTLPKRENPPVTPERLIGVGPCRKPLDIEVLPNPEFLVFFESWRGFDSAAIRDYIPRAQDFFDQSIAILEREADCIDALRVENVFPYYDPTAGSDDSYLGLGQVKFLDEDRYRAVVLDDWRVGDRQFDLMEISAFARAWSETDVTLYLNAAANLRSTADQFRDQLTLLEKAIADMAPLEDALRDSTGQVEDPDARVQLDHLRATLWEQFLPVQQTAPVYMGYLATGLNRWAVAEERLMTLTFPRMMDLVDGRLAKLEALAGGPCGIDTNFSHQFHNAPVEIAAAAPHFSNFRPAQGESGRDAIFHASGFDRLPLRWETPNSVTETVGWQVDPGLLDLTRMLPPARRGCPNDVALASAVTEMANWQNVYGEQTDALMGKGTLYENLVGDTAQFLPEAETEVTCLRCAAIARALQNYSTALQNLSNAPEKGFTNPGWLESHVFEEAVGQPFIVARLAALREEQEECDSICVSIEVAPVAVPLGADPEVIALIDQLIVTYSDQNVPVAVIDALQEMRRTGVFEPQVLTDIMLNAAGSSQ